MTSEHRLFAILAFCLCLGAVVERVASHDGCIAFCPNIANAGAP